jgi:ADP-ribosylglycohydrolase
MTSPGSDASARLSRALLSLEGLSVGDAFGELFFSPHVFESPGEPPPPPWWYTDDTVMAISLVENLARHGRVEQDELARAFAARYAEDDRRGYGSGAHLLLMQVGAGRPWRDAAAEMFDGLGSMGNGSAMRVAPLGAYFADDVPLLVEQAALSAEVTHFNDEGRAGAVAVALAAAWAWNHRSEGGAGGGSTYAPRLVREFMDFVLAHTPASRTRDGIADAVDLPRSTDVASAARALGNGSRVTCPDTVPLCVWLCARHLGRYRDALLATVSAAGDIDTNCAIVGGIVVLSAAEGRDAIPVDWLKSREPLEPLRLSPS